MLPGKALQLKAEGLVDVGQPDVEAQLRGVFVHHAAQRHHAGNLEFGEGLLEA